MAENQSSDVQQRIIKGLKLNPARDLMPTKVGSMIVPTFQANKPIPIIREVADEAANDSNKTFTVPEGRTWKLLYGFVDFTSTATVGNRRIDFRILDGNGSILMRVIANAIQAESLNETYLLMIADTPQETNADFHMIPIPRECWLPSGWAIQIFDSAAIAATADDLIIRLVVEEYDHSTL